ncbi:MAG: diacylglycerol/lipid kinase family protein [Solirubrobacteraceae bacterium]
MTLALIVNPSAGGGKAGRTLGDVRAELTRLGLEHHAELTRSLDHARELARQAAAAGETAVAFGGDGLVGAVAEALSGCDGVLGVLPGGRGNDFARTLGIPRQPVPACEVLRIGVARSLDLGDVDSHAYVGIASCGFDSVANRIANETRLVRGNLVYAYGLLRALVSWKPATFTIELDGGEVRTVHGYSVAAANSKFFGGGMMLAPDASLQDGLLEIVIIGDAPRLRYLVLAPTVFRGEHVGQPNVEVIRSSSVRISASREFTLYADGDPIAELPVTVTARPAAVRTIVPAFR